MVAGSSGNDGESGCNGQKEMIPLKKTIQHIKEIVKDHSEADIYAALEESHMDANETAQKLLAQDPFHEVKRRRDRKKESVGPPSYIIDNRRLADDNAHWVKSHTTWGGNFQKGGYTRNSSAGVNKAFRVVRDNRLNQNISKDLKQEKVQHSPSSIDKTLPNISDGRARTEEKHSGSFNSDKSLLSAGASKLGNGSLQANDSSGIKRAPLVHEEKQAIVSSSKSQQSENSSQLHSKGPNNSVIGVYSSSLDPVHVPSPVSRSAGTVGAIRREVGVVGGRRMSSDQSFTRSSVSANPFSVSLAGKSISSQAETSSHTGVTSKSNQSNQVAPPVPILPNTSLGKSIQSNHYNSKLHQSAPTHQKAIQSTMEWKPKSIPNPSNVIPDDGGKGSDYPSRADNSCSLNRNVCGLSEELAEVSLAEKHVTIPRHLVVPESEIVGLTFGSFGAEINKITESTCTFQQPSDVEHLTDQQSKSMSTSLSVYTNADAIVAQHGDTVEGYDRAFMSDSAVSAAEFEEHAPANDNIISSQHVESYADIGLIKSNSTPFSSSEENQLQNDSNLSSFSQVYGNQTNYDAPFFRTAIDDNVFSARAVSSGPLPTLGMAQTHQMQQQQPLAQLYPQVPLPHYPNFVPFRHIFSPVYVPQMAMPNYSTNPGYPHPSSGNGYLMMPGGSSHPNASNVKYATSQYKPIPANAAAGYGSYSNPAGFTINAPGNVSTATGLDELNRIKYKDSTLYVPNLQADTSDMWVQTPRELSGMQSAPYYNMPGQTPHAAAPFMPAHTGHAYNAAAAAQSQHVQYPGMYHPQQQASMANHHPHLMHQQVPSAMGGSSVGVGGMAAPGGQVGTYQQPQLQLGHLNWTANF